MEDLKNKIEAVLFSVGKKISAENISRLCRATLEDVLKELKKLQQEYSEKDGALVILDEGEKWSLNVREKHATLTKKIVADTELSKTLMETLAVIAWKQPIRQSELIRIRTNKAYDHIKELDNMGFITSEKHGRTKLLKVTEKFFNYFEISGAEDIRKVFKGVKEIAEETVKMKEKKQSVEEVETFGEKEPEQESEEKLGDLEVFDEEEKQEPEDEEENNEVEEQEEKQEEDTEEESEEKTEEEPKQESEDETEELIDEELNK
ncbi:SMC-Scp complex subunit ScpB [Candidatus Woesearchaeota archaeon]|nr:SMC-Scp complex subunit ScpB [Candidatus Woesearchaeota archaeon]